jgi:hypothetical protein
LAVGSGAENDGKHGIWFNRGAIASQAYAREFGNHKLTNAEMDDPNDKHTKWLSRGLLEACLDYIDSTKRGQALRACVLRIHLRAHQLSFDPARKPEALLPLKNGSKLRDPVRRRQGRRADAGRGALMHHV